MAVYKKGSIGEQVKQIQKALGIKVDGIFGKGMEDAVKKFQQENGLTVDGKADLTGLIEDLKRVADVNVKTGKAIVTIICDASRSSVIIAKAFDGLSKEGINVQMISQGASKVNISILVDTNQADKTVEAIHSVLFA